MLIYIFRRQQTDVHLPRKQELHLLRIKPLSCDVLYTMLHFPSWEWEVLCVADGGQVWPQPVSCHLPHAWCRPAYLSACPTDGIYHNFHLQDTS